MSVDEHLLSILCCPATKQSLRLADEAVVLRINQFVSRGILVNVGQKLVSDKIEGGLIRSDGQIVYPIRENIPVMLIEEGIALDQLS